MNKLIEQYNKSKKKRLDSRTKSLPHYLNLNYQKKIIKEVL